MQKRKLMQRMGKLGRSVLRAPFQPLHTLLRALRLSQLTVKFRDPKAVHCARVQRCRGLPEKLQRLPRLPPASPAVLAARACAVGSVGMPMFRSEHEQRVRPVKILLVLRRADAVGEAVC